MYDFNIKPLSPKRKKSSKKLEIVDLTKVEEVPLFTSGPNIDIGIAIDLTTLDFCKETKTFSQLLAENQSLDVPKTQDEPGDPVETVSAMEVDEAAAVTSQAGLCELIPLGLAARSEDVAAVLNVESDFQKSSLVVNTAVPETNEESRKEPKPEILAKRLIESKSDAQASESSLEGNVDLFNLLCSKCLSVDSSNDMSLIIDLLTVRFRHLEANCKHSIRFQNLLEDVLKKCETRPENIYVHLQEVKKELKRLKKSGKQDDTIPDETPLVIKLEKGFHYLVNSSDVDYAEYSTRADQIYNKMQSLSETDGMTELTKLKFKGSKFRKFDKYITKCIYTKYPPEYEEVSQRLAVMNTKQHFGLEMEEMEQLVKETFDKLTKLRYKYRQNVLEIKWKRFTALDEEIVETAPKEEKCPGSVHSSM